MSFRYFTFMFTFSFSLSHFVHVDICDIFLYRPSVFQWVVRIICLPLIATVSVVGVLCAPLSPYPFSICLRPFACTHAFNILLLCVCTYFYLPPGCIVFASQPYHHYYCYFSIFVCGCFPLICSLSIFSFLSFSLYLLCRLSDK